MKIRSITYFLDPGWPLDEIRMRSAGEFMRAARPAFEAAGYEVQTTRIATVPFPQLLKQLPLEEIVDLAQAMETAALDQGYDYLCVGPALPHHPGSYAVIPDVLAATSRVFLAGMMAPPQGGISLPAVRACAEVIHRTARLDPNGFKNLFFSALTNVGPGSPFFPAAYHGGGPPAFALATEAAILAVEAVSAASSLAEARQNLTAAVEEHSQAMVQASRTLAAESGVSFGGIDFSVAPYPEQARSVGTAMEQLGVPAVGLPGSLAAAALITSSLDRAKFARIGFSGLMLPLMEDSTLAARAAQGVLSVTDLMLYSAVCGVGLDTLPLPGDITPQQLYGILLDLATLSKRLDKPLTARLMPIPGKRAGDQTDFDFEYFVNSRVLALPSDPVGGLLAGDETLEFGL